MARSNSKYFASVITKLLAHKRKENIQIDESFKMMLRSDILTKAASVLGEQQRLPETGGKSFFAQWKYLFAAVPTFALLVFVGSQFMNMPVVIPEGQLPNAEQDTIVEPDNQDNVKEPSVETEQEVGSDNLSETENDQTSTTRIKTFPGSLVLTPEKEDVQDAVVVEPSVQEQESDEQPATNTTNQPASQVQPLSFQLLGLNVNVSSNEERGDNVPVFDESPEVHSNDLDAEPTIQQVEDDVPPTIQSVQESEAPVVQPVDEPTVEPAQRIDASGMVAVETTAMEIEPSVRQVDYAMALSSVQEVKMEEKVIPRLAGGRKIKNVVVSEQEPGIVAVNMRFVDGGETTAFYTFNEKTGVWDHVQYVNKAYYDNGLSYTTNFTYVK
ncbi:MAG TPA: hypothetical protein PKA32_02630 [Candidatus Gracilibacteria bacterium]|nr:hypothetical protein [Candidatus Gracilibacteria bacterium]